jgi:hypothetical protein
MGLSEAPIPPRASVALRSASGPLSGYVKNQIAKPRVRMKVGRGWYAGTAAIVGDGNTHAHHAGPQHD